MTEPHDELRVKLPPVVRGSARVLDAQSWSIPGPPAVVGIVGNNGAGKSSLFLNLANLLACMSQSDWHLRDQRLTSRAFLSQHPALPPWLTTDEYARAFGFTISDLETYVPGLKMGELTGARIAHLSEGQVQALALALTLAAEADITLLDEPLSALDLRRQKGFRGFLAKWKVGASGRRLTLLSTQSATDIVGLCDAVVVLHEGTCRYAGPVAGLLAPTRVQRNPHACSPVRDKPVPLCLDDPRAFQVAVEDAVVGLLG